MELLKLLGIVIVIAGFALKLDSILVILVAAVVTALVGGLGPVTLLETLGSTFVANRSMAIFIIVMLVTGTLERNGLREAAAALIGKFKGATSGLVIGIYGVMRSVFAAFNVGFGGVAGFVRPVIMPMAEGAIVAQGYEPVIIATKLDKIKRSQVQKQIKILKGYGFRHGEHHLVLRSGPVRGRLRRPAGAEHFGRPGHRGGAGPAGCHRDPRVHHCHCGRHRILCDQGSQDDPEVL